jgi:magnesium transporter
MVALVAFLPLIISSGGNAGAQSATLITRAIALGEVHWDDFFKVVFREAAIGILLGLILGALGALRGVLGGEIADVSLIVGSTLFLVVLFATLTGSGIPLMLHRAGFDPAVSSSPFIASLVDVFGLIIYCNIAIAVMKYGFF